LTFFRDVYYEKFGFMLAFWNMAGVPLSYCHCTLYLANHEPSEYKWNNYALALFFAIYLLIYWVWDTSNGQKNSFRAKERGTYVKRNTFPQLPWQVVENPKIIKTSTGDSLLADGWYGYARKVHYTCDLFFALSWGLITGFKSPFPWFYPLFFAAMISHRAARDIEKCKAKYGKSWTEYEKQVPYLFIPVSLNIYRYCVDDKLIIAVRLLINLAEGVLTIYVHTLSRYLNLISIHDGHVLTYWRVLRLFPPHLNASSASQLRLQHADLN